MNEQGNISIHAQNIMPIIKKWLYSDKDIFIRELVSNGCDAVTKRRIAEGEDAPAGTVTVQVDETANELRFVDNGIGMTADEVQRYINQVAFSSAEEFIKQYEGADKGGIIGHFGLGFYSAFMVSERVTIDTLSCLPGSEGVRWTSEDGMTYQMEPSDRTEIGTMITLVIQSDEKDFLKKYRVREVLERYCAFMNTPVYLEEVGKPDEEPKPINETRPLWLKDPKECTEEEYKDFYTKVFHEFEPPLFWVHLNVDYPFNLKGILYFPKLKQEFGAMTEGPIKLFSGQVFVADNIKEVIPEFLTLLKGAIDCPDLPLNVSRSFLQNDGYVKKLSAYITRKVADRLTGLFNTERETYEKYWADIHPFVKYGCMKDESFYDRVKEILLFKTSEGPFLTRQEYLDKNKEKAENKVFYSTDEKRQAATISLYMNQGIDVMVLDSPIDVNFISFLEYKDNQVKYSRVDADLTGLTEKTEDTPKLDAKRLETLFRDALDEKELTVTLEPLKEEMIPAIILEEEQMRRFRDMSRLFGHTDYSGAPQYKLVLNPRCAVIQALDNRPADDETLTICRQIFDLAEMARQPLEPEAMRKFIARGHEMLAWLAVR